MAKIVCTSYLFPDQVDRLTEAGHEVWVHEGKDPVPRDRLAAELHDAEGLICLLTDRIDRELLAAASSLRIVANVAVGPRGQKVLVYNAPSFGISALFLLIHIQPLLDQDAELFGAGLALLAWVLPFVQL